MAQFKSGDKVAAPVVLNFPERKYARSRYGYDIGTVVATGQNKKSGKPAIKVKFTTGETQWVKKITKEPMFEKWCLAADCDKI